MKEKTKNVSFEELIIQKRKLDEAKSKVDEIKKSFNEGNYLETNINKKNEEELYFLALLRIYYRSFNLSQEDMEKRFETDLEKFNKEKSEQRKQHAILVVNRTNEKIAYKEDANHISYLDDSLFSPKIPRIDLTAKQFKN